MTDLATIDLDNLYDRALDEWYDITPGDMPPAETFESVILAQHFCNFSIWNLEDRARCSNVPDGTIVEVKRGIDRWNQSRNDLAEMIDELVLREFQDIDTGSARLHSETAGMMLDRLSIASLKIRHMAINAGLKDDPEVAGECAEKLEILKQQRADLNACLRELLADFRNGARCFKTYRQLKQYNDPRLNPLLREESKSG
jgi:hypothetical protein